MESNEYKFKTRCGAASALFVHKCHNTINGLDLLSYSDTEKYSYPLFPLISSLPILRSSGLTTLFTVGSISEAANLLLLLHSPTISLGFTILGKIFAYVTIFNPTIGVVMFRLRGWCMLGVFLLPAFTRLGHECQDLLSLCDGMHVSTG